MCWCRFCNRESLHLCVGVELLADWSKVKELTLYMKGLVTKRDKRHGEKIELPPRKDRR